MPAFQPEDTHVTGRRVVAQIIDSAVWGTPWLIGSLAGSDWIGLAVFLVWFPAYFGLLQGGTGWTLGKLMTGIRVVDERGHSPGTWAGIQRSLTLFVEFLGVVALVLILRSPWRQRGGDRWADTYVVRRTAAS